MRSLITAVVAGSLGFAAARMSGWPFAAENGESVDSAKVAPQPAREIAAIAPPSPPFTPAPDPVKPIADRLKAALRSKNPLEAAALVLPVIDSMRLEDFQKLAAEPGRMPIPFLGSFDKQFCDGFMARKARLKPIR